MKQFDLNIDKILEDWDLSDAIRELIANAIDEAMLTKTRAPELTKDSLGCWHVRDFGRGLRYQDLIQSENPEKRASPSVIGKFGIGLKDALATFERRGVKVLIKSRYGDITLSRVSKHSFEDIVTLHATVLPPSSPDLEGTDCCLPGVADSHVSAAKQMFLRFNAAGAIEETTFGAVYPRSTSGGVVYVNGMKVAEEPNFLFTYNITSLNSAIRRALNRERRNVGRMAYVDRVKSILLACKSREVAKSLADDLEEEGTGEQHDEMTWLDVQEHAARVLNAQKKVVFLSPAQVAERPDIVDEARSTGHRIITVPERLSNKIQGTRDVCGNPILESREFTKQRNESFRYSWVAPESLTPTERATWNWADRILRHIGGRPANVRGIRISETMSCGALSRPEVGTWVPSEGLIVIKRTELRSLDAFAGTLLHEAIHAKTGLSDVSREFESKLTALVGEVFAEQQREGERLAVEQRRLATERQNWEREREKQRAADRARAEQLAAEQRRLELQRQDLERERENQPAADRVRAERLVAGERRLALDRQEWEREREKQRAADQERAERLAAAERRLALERQNWERERENQHAAERDLQQRDARRQWEERKRKALHRAKEGSRAASLVVASAARSLARLTDKALCGLRRRRGARVRRVVVPIRRWIRNADWALRRWVSRLRNLD
jgi:hypothetical protein